MMWGIGLWGIVHLSIVGRPTVLVIGTAILLLAIAGALGQDRKKRRLLGPDWDSWAAQTSFLPFAWGLSLPGWSAFLVGTALFLLLTFAHQWLGAIPAGPWHWL
jgi:uncharacterized membrane protein